MTPAPALTSSPLPEPPSGVEQGGLEPLHVRLLHRVVPVIEEGELVVDLGDPGGLAIVLALSYRVYLLLKLLQTCDKR